MRRHLRSLTLRLLVPVLFLVAVGFVGQALFLVRSGAEHWTELKRNSAQRMAVLIEDATHFGMLLKRREEVHETIRTIAQTPGVAGIRIYDKQGKVAFSSHEAEIGDQVDKDDVACVMCHRNARPWAEVDKDAHFRTFRTEAGEGILGYIEPIEKKPGCASGSCHDHDGQSVLGVLDVQMSTADIDEAQSQVRRQVTLATLAVVVLIGLAVAWFMQAMVRRPIRQLMEGTRRVASGDLTLRLPVTQDDEVGALAVAFNQMTADLETTHAELTAFSQELEGKVVQKSAEIAAMQRQQMQVEKMASLGKLAAVVAHELNNPLGGILTYAKLVNRKLGKQTIEPAVRTELSRCLGLIESESARCGDIVRNMLLFARKGPGQAVLVAVGELVDRTAMLVKHKFELAQVRLELLLEAADDQVVGDPGELQQALLALVINGVEACSARPAGEGCVRIRVTGDDDTLTMAVEDNGVGIPADVLPRIFEPFFSTKEKSGVGIGLAVVYGIARRHGGTLEVDSVQGQGSTFRVKVQRCPPEPPAGGEDDSGDMDPQRREASG